MTRLNNRIRDDIVKAAIEKAGINEANRELRQRRADWAESVRLDAIGGAETVAKIEAAQKRIDRALKEVPDKLLSTRNLFNFRRSIYLNIAGQRAHAVFNGGRTTHNGFDRVHKIAPDEHVLLADSALAEQFAQLEAEAEALADKECTLRSNVRATVAKFGTVKRLKEAWPEVAELLPKDLSPAKNTLPAVPVGDLNSMIGLPTDKAS